MGNIEIPEGVKKQIEQEAHKWNPPGNHETDNLQQNAIAAAIYFAEYGYLLMQQQLAEKEREIERLKDVLHIDRSGLAKALAEVNKTVDSYHWITEGRGPYAYNDDEYRKEAGYMLEAIKKIADNGLQNSGNLAHAEC